MYDDPQLVEKTIGDRNKVLRATNLLTSWGKFDLASEAFQNSKASVKKMKPHFPEVGGINHMEEFQSMNPVETEHRRKEAGFVQARERTKTIINAEEANDLGKKSWAKELKWQAELWWERATELDPKSQAKYWSNLAFVRTHLGRYLRSLVLGYRSLGTKMIEAALTAAQTSIEIDPQWERGYLRAAEAHFHLGPYDHAMDACRILKKAVDTVEVEKQSSRLKGLHETARERSLLWWSLGIPPPEATVPKLLERALGGLHIAVIESLPLYAESACWEEATKVAKKIVDQVLLINAIVQLVYLRQEELDMIAVQQQMHQIARILPLTVIAKSPLLKQIVFVEDPFTLWGLNQLDRAGADHLNWNAKNPCAGDGYAEADTEFGEFQKRHTGGGATSISEMMMVVESIYGKMDESIDPDYAPNYLCSFSLTILQRLALASQMPLSYPALVRTLEFTGNEHSIWAGGEFLGLAICAAVGIAKYDFPGNPDRAYSVMRIPGAVGAVTVEINQSKDLGFRQRKALLRLTPADWAAISGNDIHTLLLNYVLLTLDGTDDIGTDTEVNQWFAVEILSSLLEGHPEMIAYLRTAAGSPIFPEFQPLLWSSFGYCLVHNFVHSENKQRAEEGHTSTKRNLRRLARKWNNLSQDEKSAYRWESLDDRAKQQLASIAPKSDLDLAKERLEGEAAKGGSRDIRKLPECARCGKMEGRITEKLRDCAGCVAVVYCSEECQIEDWSQHKRICRKISRAAKKEH